MQARLRAAARAFKNPKPVQPPLPASSMPEKWSIESPHGYSSTITMVYDEHDTIIVSREAMTGILADAGYRRLA